MTGVRDATKSDTSKNTIDRVMIKIDDFMEKFDAEDSSFEDYNEWSFTMNPIQRSPFHTSYRDPTVNCFTYNTEYNQFVSLRQIEVQLNITKFQRLSIFRSTLFVSDQNRFVIFHH